MLKALALVSIACVGLSGCLFAERATEIAGGDGVDHGAESHADGFDGWTIHVALEAPDLGPLRVSVGPLERARRATDARAWVRNELVFENLGRGPLQFADTRTSAFIGPRGHRALLAADEGCGYAKASSASAVEAGVCALYLDALRIGPRSSASRTITLFKDLRRMPLVEGTYVLEKRIRYARGRQIPTVGNGREAVLRLVYEIAQIDG